MAKEVVRREFLERVAAGGIAASLTIPAAARGRSVQDKLVVGLIGCGGRGLHDARLFKQVPNVEIAYVCDVDSQRRQQAARDLQVPDNRSVGDLRHVLDDQSVDAVLVTTPDHWHSPAAILACASGKHVYVEKPISHNVREGRLLVDMSRRTKTLVQHGTQSRSTPMMIEAIRLLHESIIGDVLAAKCWNIQRRSTIGRGVDGAPPPELDYDTWIGPATMIPYRSNRVHNRWTWWYHFGAGDMGNDGVHDLDYTRWGLGVEGHPTRISGHGGKYFFDDDQEFPDTQQVTFEYSPQGSKAKPRMLVYEQRLWDTNHPHHCDSGAEFYGTRGQMFLSRRGKLEVRDDRGELVAVDVKPGAHDDAAHVANFCDAVRDGVSLNADALTGHLSSSLCHLGNIATRVGRSLLFDGDREQILGDDQANLLVQREYRPHWGRPE
jgi:predicted dehydrogenase